MTNSPRKLGDFTAIAAGIVGGGHKRYIGRRFFCRFCGESGDSTKFKHKAHAIPEFLGNHQLLLNSECDRCNSHFGNTIERDLERYTNPLRAISGVTRKGRKTAKHEDQKIRSLAVDRHTQELSIKLSEDDALTHYDGPENIVSWEMQRVPFSPYGAYKALCKIAASVVDDSLLPLFQPTLDWLNPGATGEIVPKPALVVETLTPGYRYESCVYWLYLRTGKQLPHCMLWIGFGTYSLQALIPVSLDFESSCSDTFEMPLFPDSRSESDIERFGQRTHVEHDFSSKDLVAFPHRVNVRFESKLETCPPDRTRLES